MRKLLFGVWGTNRNIGSRKMQWIKGETWWKALLRNLTKRKKENQVLRKRLEKNTIFKHQGGQGNEHDSQEL